MTYETATLPELKKWTAPDKLVSATYGDVEDGGAVIEA